MKVKEGYYLLSDDVYLEPGDLFLRNNSTRWDRCHSSVSRTVEGARRYFSQDQNPVQFCRKLPVLEDGYRYLEVGEETKFGDELINGRGEWVRAMPGDRQRDGITFRQKKAFTPIPPTGFRLVEDHEPTKSSDMVSFAGSNFAWITYGRKDLVGKTPVEINKEHSREYPWVFARKIEEWQPTEEFRAIPQRKWVRGDEVEWRNV